MSWSVWGCGVYNCDVARRNAVRARDDFMLVGGDGSAPRDGVFDNLCWSNNNYWWENVSQVPDGHGIRQQLL